MEENPHVCSAVVKSIKMMADFAEKSFTRAMSEVLVANTSDVAETFRIADRKAIAAYRDFDAEMKEQMLKEEMSNGISLLDESEKRRGRYS